MSEIIILCKSCKCELTTENKAKGRSICKSCNSKRTMKYIKENCDVPDAKSEYHKEYNKEYNKRPEVIASRKEYNQREDVLEKKRLINNKKVLCECGVYRGYTKRIQHETLSIQHLQYLEMKNRK